MIEASSEAIPCEDIDLEIAAHDQAMLTAFANVLRIEEGISGVKAQMDNLKSQQELLERGLENAWEEVADLIAETGKVEVILPGAGVDYKIGYSTPRETVKVEPDAVPDEFCKIERKPKLAEIGKHFNELRNTGRDLPNWGGFQTGVSRLTWKAIKKTTRGE